MPEQSADDREETLCAIPLCLPLKVRVISDVGGVSVLGLGAFKGCTGSGSTHAAALSDFFDGLIMDYYEFWLYPSDVQSTSDDEKGKLLHRLFHPSGSGTWKRKKA
jgi:hypothetical protein